MFCFCFSPEPIPCVIVDASAHLFLGVGGLVRELSPAPAHRPLVRVNFPQTSTLGPKSVSPHRLVLQARFRGVAWGVADHHSDPHCSAQAVIGQAATKAPIRSVCGKENAPLPYPFGGRASGVRRSLNPRLLRGDRGPFSFAGDDDVKARTFKHPPKLPRHAKTPQGLYSTREKLNVPEVRGQGQGRPLSACTCCCTCICSCTEERGKSVACASHYLNFAEAHTHRCSLDPPATCSSR